MTKKVFILLFFLFVVISAFGQINDTTISYFKYHPGFLPERVLKPDSADFVRIVYPNPTGAIHDIREYYANGIIKLRGTIDLNSNKYGLTFVGDFISYYQNGKRQSISHYTDGKKLGLEYLFYPNGHLYAVKKWIYGTELHNDDLHWECYDKNDNKICDNGNGPWTIYNNDYSDVIFSGEVKKGYMNGQWQGYDVLEDTIKYTCRYKTGALISGIGYDKNEITHPFRDMNVSTTYKRGSLFTFLDDLNRHLILPKGANGKKINIDSVYISFVIEKDGHLDELKQLGVVNNELQVALNEAVKKCGEWIPLMCYGMPYRSFFVTSLKVKTSYYENSRLIFRMINYNGKLINSTKAKNTNSAQPD